MLCLSLTLTRVLPPSLFPKDPEIGTSYENTRIKGERCPNAPNPPVCEWEIFKEEFEEQQAAEEEQRKQQALEAQRRFREEEMQDLQQETALEIR